jgi:hypothetical protein
MFHETALFGASVCAAGITFSTWTSVPGLLLAQRGVPMADASLEARPLPRPRVASLRPQPLLTHAFSDTCHPSVFSGFGLCHAHTAVRFAVIPIGPVRMITRVVTCFRGT